MLLSSNFLKKKQNEQMLLQHVVNEVIWFIASLIFNVLCFGFYFHFQILNLLLIFSCSLQVFTNLCGGQWQLFKIADYPLHFYALLDISKIQSSFFQLLCLFCFCACAFVLNGMHTMQSQMVYTPTSSFLIRL